MSMSAARQHAAAEEDMEEDDNEQLQSADDALKSQHAHTQHCLQHRACSQLVILTSSLVTLCLL